VLANGSSDFRGPIKASISKIEKSNLKIKKQQHFSSIRNQCDDIINKLLNKTKNFLYFFK
jgi:hypothetical protein